MKTIAMSVLALMTLSMQMAHADGAGNAINRIQNQNVSCVVTVADGAQTEISARNTSFSTASVTEGDLSVELKVVSGNVDVAVSKAGVSEGRVTGQISGHGYFHGNTTGASVSCATN